MSRAKTKSIGLSAMTDSDEELNAPLPDPGPRDGTEAEENESWPESESGDKEK